VSATRTSHPITRESFLTKFETLGLSPPILRALQAECYETATPIQQQAIPQALQGRDLLGRAQTGTGKTAAFAIPTLQQLLNNRGPYAKLRNGRRARRPRVRALILAPTRELAEQIGESFARYGRFTHLREAAVFGGVRQGPQVRALQSGVDVLVATPGRLLDLMGQGFVRLDAVEILILDEADRMLDMGFIHDLRKILAHVPSARQTLMFSATMPDAMRRLAADWLRKPVHIQATAITTTPARVQQSVCFVERARKSHLLSQFLGQKACQRTLVFARTKRRADTVARSLNRAGIRAVSIHGDKSQGARRAAIGEFKSPNPPVLVATDVAARGLDVAEISHVVNYDLPDVPETYIHRIGRTARAGADGCAISFCDCDERPRLELIEQFLGQTISVRGILPGSTESQILRSELRSSEERATDSCGKARRHKRPPFPADQRPRKQRRKRLPARPHEQQRRGVARVD
jgi:ATP-dependent RNA helicase RhlE